MSKNYTEKANQVTTTDTAAIIGERLVPEDESVEVVVVVVGVVTAGVGTVVLPPDEGVPDGAAADALPTVTATFMPLPQWPEMPQMK